MRPWKALLVTGPKPWMAPIVVCTRQAREKDASCGTHGRQRASSFSAGGATATSSRVVMPAATRGLRTGAASCPRGSPGPAPGAISTFPRRSRHLGRHQQDLITNRCAPCSRSCGTRCSHRPVDAGQPQCFQGSPGDPRWPLCSGIRGMRLLAVGAGDAHQALGHDAQQGGVRR